MDTAFVNIGKHGIEVNVLLLLLGTKQKWDFFRVS